MNDRFYVVTRNITNPFGTERLTEYWDFTEAEFTCYPSTACMTFTEQSAVDVVNHEGGDIEAFSFYRVYGYESPTTTTSASEEDHEAE